MLGILSWLIIGLVAGLVARALVPGRQSMGLFATMILGIVGSLVGGFLSTVLFGQDPANPGFHPAGFIMSTIGAILALVLFVRTTARTI